VENDTNGVLDSPVSEEVVIVVHGTFATDAEWTREQGLLAAALRE
jgi:hypothetical protein